MLMLKLLTNKHKYIRMLMSKKSAQIYWAGTFTTDPLVIN